MQFDVNHIKQFTKLTIDKKHHNKQHFQFKNRLLRLSIEAKMKFFSLLHLPLCFSLPPAGVVHCCLWMLLVHQICRHTRNAQLQRFWPEPFVCKINK